MQTIQTSSTTGERSASRGACIRDMHSYMTRGAICTDILFVLHLSLYVQWLPILPELESRLKSGEDVSSLSALMPIPLLEHVHDEYLAHRVLQAYECARFIASFRRDDFLTLLCGDLNCPQYDLCMQLIQAIPFGSIHTHISYTCSVQPCCVSFLTCSSLCSCSSLPVNPAMINILLGSSIPFVRFTPIRMASHAAHMITHSPLVPSLFAWSVVS